MHYFTIQNNSHHLEGSCHILGSFYVKYQKVKGSYFIPGPKETDANILHTLGLPRWHSGKESAC